MSGLTRRRFIAITATAIVVPGQVVSAFASAPPPALWRGIALGARAEIRIDGLDATDAANVLAECRREIDRLENLFSLYRADSAIARLNRTGVLRDPEPDFLELLSTAASVNRASGGLFDPTVQPLWQAYAKLYSAGRGFDRDIASATVEQFGGRVGFEHLRFGPAEVAFQRPGMALTLNGIAQGYITDKIASLMRAHGMRHVLVNVGELRALDGRRDGSSWPVQIVSPDDDTRGRTVFLNNRALATSATSGTTFDAAGRFGHIFDPRDGKPASQRRQVTVEAPTATLADALSTACCLMRNSEARAVLSTFPDTRFRT